MFLKQPNHKIFNEYYRLGDLFPRGRTLSGPKMCAMSQKENLQTENDTCVNFNTCFQISDVDSHRPRAKHFMAVRFTFWSYQLWQQAKTPVRGKRFV